LFCRKNLCVLWLSLNLMTTQALSLSH
jgi:hypothetical protein